MNVITAKTFVGLGMIAAVFTLFMIPTLGYATSASDVSRPTDDKVTTICPDGTVILAVMECPNPNPTQAECPPNQLVIITPTGDCTAVPAPFECPNGVVAPIEEQCNDSLPPTIPSLPASVPQLLQPSISELQPPSLPEIPSPFEALGTEESAQGGGQNDDDDDSNIQSEGDSTNNDDGDGDGYDDDSNESSSDDSDDDDSGGELD